MPEQGRGPEEPSSDAVSRPGLHAWDRSYWQLYLGWRGLNVSLEWTATNAGQGHDADQQLSLLATVVGGNASDFSLVLTGSFVFSRGGVAAAVPFNDRARANPNNFQPRTSAIRSLRLASPGLRNITVLPLFGEGGKAFAQDDYGTAAATHSASAGVATTAIANVTLAFGHDGITAASTSLLTVDAVQAAVASARRLAVIRLPGATPALLQAATAMQSCLMWNGIYDPVEAAPFVQVSRSFAAQPFELFEWDTQFGALMLSMDAAALPLAVSSLIQIIKSKTLGPQLDGHGFVPGYSKGGRWLSEDRTERPVGAQMLLRIWRRWADNTGVGDPSRQNTQLQWVLQLLYPDLLDWHAWMWAERRSDPLGLAVMGSDPCVVPGANSSQLWCKPSWGMGKLQGARFESLDNSPM